MPTNTICQTISGFTVLNIIDRSEIEIFDLVAPFAKCGVVVEPTALTESFSGILTSGWEENAGRYDSYGRYFGERLVFVSMEGKYWITEISYPTSTTLPKILALGSGLVVTRNPMAAVQLAKACVEVGPPPPLRWGPYWGAADSQDAQIEPTEQVPDRATTCHQASGHANYLPKA